MASTSLKFIPIVTILVIINAGMITWNVGHWATGLAKVRKHADAYTYTGPDFPPLHPTLPRIPASLTLQESVGYGSNGSDPVSSQEWETLKGHPHGLGRAFLGSESREFLMAFYHQLHCVREIERGLVNRDDSEGTPHHMKHCLDYLRQTILCSATDALEKGDFLERDWETQRIGGDLLCWDWEVIYKEMGDGWDNFTTWRDERTKPLV